MSWRLTFAPSCVGCDKSNIAAPEGRQQRRAESASPSSSQHQATLPQKPPSSQVQLRQKPTAAAAAALAAGIVSSESSSWSRSSKSTSLMRRACTARRRGRRRQRSAMLLAGVCCCLLTLTSLGELACQSAEAASMDAPPADGSLRQGAKVEPATGAPDRPRRAAFFAPLAHEVRASGSKSEPPSRPSQDWSKQRPYFGADIQRNVSVELGKTAYLTCKVFELGDKTVSWLRPRENEILTAGRYTYIGDPRFASINDNGSNDWILEIKDVGLNDSTNYECQVSTDPKMSITISLHVKAAKARIRQGEQFYASVGSNIEFTCEIANQRLATIASSLVGASHMSLYQSTPPNGVQQTYWYHNGNLLNYAKAHQIDKNFTIDWDPGTQTSRFKLLNLQMQDAGNYTCKPTSAEPTTIRLHVKRYNKNGLRDRANHNNGYYSMSAKEAQRNRQNHFDQNGFELIDNSGTGSKLATYRVMLSVQILASILLTINLRTQ